MYPVYIARVVHLTPHLCRLPLPRLTHMHFHISVHRSKVSGEGKYEQVLNVIRYRCKC